MATSNMKQRNKMEQFNANKRHGSIDHNYQASDNQWFENKHNPQRRQINTSQRTRHGKMIQASCKLKYIEFIHYS